MKRRDTVAMIALGALHFAIHAQLLRRVYRFGVLSYFITQELMAADEVIQ